MVASLPILITGDGPLYNAVTAVVNLHGAMILTPAQYGMGQVLEIQNVKTGVAARCRVVWIGGQERPGTYKLGIELMDERPDFWGVDYAAALLASGFAAPQ